MKRSMLVLAAFQVSCTLARQHAPSTSLRAPSVHIVALPGASPSGVSLDYLAYDRARGRVWVPAGETGTVVVVDVVGERVAVVDRFKTAEMERHGTKRVVGPSSATVGAGVVYVGNRADASVCAVDAESLRIRSCVTLDAMPDGLAYVPSTKEVWVTTPRQNSITILDASPDALTSTGKIHLDGAPEGFAVDDARGVFYTNLEDKDRTLTIDLVRRRVTKTWVPGCGAAGPRGLALDRGLDVLVVACPDRLVALDAGHDGRVLSTLDAGDGLDNIDVLESRHDVYAAAARTATLTIAHLGPQGGLSRAMIVETRVGARNAVVTDDGVAFLTDAAEGRILVVAPMR